MEFSNDPSTMELKMNRAYLQAAGEQVTFILCILLVQERSGPLSAAARGFGGPGASTGSRRPGFRFLSLMLPSWREESPARTHRSPPWPTSPGHSSATEMYLLPLYLMPC